MTAPSTSVVELAWRIANWLRAGYPTVAPPHNYCPAIALLAPAAARTSVDADARFQVLR